MRWKRKKRSLEEAKANYSAVHPETDLSLVELHERASAPQHWAEAGRADEDLLEYSDYHDLAHLDEDHPYQDDEPDIHAGGQRAPDPWQQRQEAEAKLRAAIDSINADFDRRAQKYLMQQKLNPGPMRPELAALLRERDSKVRDLTRAHQHAQALEWAARDQPWRIATAHERQVEQAAARAFALDLGKGRFLGADPEPAGRATADIAIW
jgi:hypothetical protein